MIDFTKNGDHLLMRYVPERGPDDWLVNLLESEKDIPLSGRALYVRQEIYRPEINDGDHLMDTCYRFVVGHLVDGYYRMDRRFLGIQYDLFIHPSIKFPQEVFEEMLRQFPNSYELKKYARARVSSMIGNYVPVQTDHEAEYLKYRRSAYQDRA